MSRFGVAIPAYDGATSIARSLDSLARQRFDGDLHVVVAVNDDRQDTFAAALALSRGPAAWATCEVIRTPPGRAAAFNEADRLLPASPRLYLDQDAELSCNAVQELSDALSDRTPWHFATLRMLPPSGGGPLVRAYYVAWLQLPYVVASPATAGAYAVSVEGRQRWQDFPAIHSDDKFVRLHFQTRERVMVKAATYRCLAAPDLRALVDDRCRYDRGNIELRAHLGPVAAGDVSRWRGALGAVARRPTTWPQFTVLAAVGCAARLRQARRESR